MKILKMIYHLLIKIFSFIFSYNLYVHFKKFKNKVISHSLKRKFKKVGENFIAYDNPVIFNPQCIEIGDDFSALSDLRLEAYIKFENFTYTPQISIGNNVRVGSGCHIGSVNCIKLGNNVLLGSNVLIIDHYHGQVTQNDINIPAAKRKLYSKGPIIIGDNVWIGDNVAVMPDVCIGDNSIIGANSVVTHSIPPNTVSVGVPAKTIRNII